VTGRSPLEPRFPEEQVRPRLSDLTMVSLILAGIGFALAMVSGVGLPVAAAAVACGAVAMRRRPAERPWPLIAVVVGSVGVVIAAILLIISVTVWLPELPRLLAR
jgi:hypothetical protein